MHVAALGVDGIPHPIRHRSDYAKSIFSHSCHLSISRKNGRESAVNSLRSSLKHFSKSWLASGSVRGNGGPDGDLCPYKKTPINLPPGNKRSAILFTYSGQREGVIEQRNVRS